MEKPFKDQDLQLKKWMKELPLDAPSPDFTANVMERITAKTMVTQYQPLISKSAWIVISLLFLGALAWLYWNPSSTLIPSETLSFLDKVEMGNPFKEMQLPKTVVYAMGVMVLFLIQIPFLKRMMERSYE